MRRRTAVAASVAAVVVVAGAVIAAAASGSDSAAVAEPEPTTATVTRQTLTAAETRTGRVGFDEPATVVARVAGTVTWLADSGDTRRRGEVLFRVDQRPTVLFYGEVPAYRDLTWGSTGRDVEQLETNLAKLGYEGFTVDREFTDATRDAVEQWQDDLGLDQTGRVALGDVEFQPGATRITASRVAVGALVQPGAPVLDVSATQRSVTVELPSADRDLASVGEPVTLDVAGGGTGQVREVSAATVQGQDGTTTTYAVVLTVDGDSLADLADGATVDVSFDAQEVTDVLTVPATALLATSEGGYAVQRLRDGASELVDVDPGLFAQGMVEVAGDLAAGDVVVVAP